MLMAEEKLTETKLCFKELNYHGYTDLDTLY